MQLAKLWRITTKGGLTNWAAVGSPVRSSFEPLSKLDSSTTMRYQESETVIGYSIFEKFEECYQYNENACFIADSQSNAQTFAENGWGDPDDCRIVAVTFLEIMLDFGASCGEHAMESQAFRAFKRITELNNVTFTSEPYDGDETLLVVQVDGVKIHRDE